MLVIIESIHTNVLYAITIMPHQRYILMIVEA